MLRSADSDERDGEQALARGDPFDGPALAGCECSKFPLEHEQLAVVPNGTNVDIRWLHRGETEPGRPELLTDAVREAALPDGRGHAYLTEELAVVASMRRTLLARGLAPDQLSPKPYWRRGVANAPHGVPPKH